MINGIKDKETISEFENLLDNLVFADLISIHEQDVYLEQINANLDWQGVHYHEVKVFFGLAEPTSKFYQLLIVIQNYFFWHLKLFYSHNNNYNNHENDHDLNYNSSSTNVHFYDNSATINNNNSEARQWINDFCFI